MASVINPNPASLPEGVRRVSVRPLEFRDDDFEERYDSSTLFYDATWTDGGVVVAAPPFRNLTPAVEAMTVEALPSRHRCSFKIRNLHLHSQIWVQAPPGTRGLRMVTSFGTVQIELQPPRTDMFRGCRVLQTMIKDDDLLWVQDWVRFHRDVHGADAVLIYDNGSEAYSSAELLERLQQLSGIRQVAVVSWPFKYGPQGSLAHGHWDSMYAQPGAFEHARWSLLPRARSVLNGDVDELVHSVRGQSVFEATERSLFGVLRYRGVWVPATDHDRLEARVVPRHRDFGYHWRPPFDWKRRPPRRVYSAQKWTVVPERCPASAQWQVHRIRGWLPALPTSRRFVYRHYRRLSTGWKYDRSDLEVLDPERHVLDLQILRDQQRVDWEA